MEVECHSCICRLKVCSLQPRWPLRSRKKPSGDFKSEATTPTTPHPESKDNNNGEVPLGEAAGCMK